MSSTGEKHWYAVQTRSNCERSLTSELSAKGVRSYFPAFAELRQWSDRKQMIERAAFPGYIFVNIWDSMDERLRVLKSSGAVRILGNSKNIEPVPEREIDSIRKMLASGRECVAHPLPREGVRVRVRRGALRGVEGELVRMKNQTRLVVSIAMLSRSIAIEVDSNDVQTLQTA